MVFPFFLLYILNMKKDVKYKKRKMNEKVVKMKIFSETTRREYDDVDMVFFRNIRQSISYIDWGATVYDVFVDGRKKLVFCFSKEDHARFRDRWGKQESKDDDNE